MKLAVTDYAEALYDLVSEEPEKAAETVRRFVGVLRQQGKGKLLPVILAELSRVEAKKNGQVEAVVTVPSALTDDQKSELKVAVLGSMKEAKSVILTEVIDPSVLGGIKVKIGDMVIDHTIKTKLNTLAAKL